MHQSLVRGAGIRPNSSQYTRFRRTALSTAPYKTCRLAMGRQKSNPRSILRYEVLLICLPVAVMSAPPKPRNHSETSVQRPGKHTATLDTMCRPNAARHARHREAREARSSRATLTSHLVSSSPPTTSRVHLATGPTRTISSPNSRKRCHKQTLFATPTSARMHDTRQPERR